MNLLNKNKPVYSLEKKLTSEEKFQRFWSKNKPIIGLILVMLCISILLILVCQAVATGHIHSFSTEANIYEHMAEGI